MNCDSHFVSLLHCWREGDCDLLRMSCAFAWLLIHNHDSHDSFPHASMACTVGTIARLHVCTLHGKCTAGRWTVYVMRALCPQVTLAFVAT